MIRTNNIEPNKHRKPLGIVLLVTLMVLVVLSTLGYTLSRRVAAQRHRDLFIIDYQTARYARDSAVKYAMATLKDMNTPQLVARPNEPDFSDLFHLSQIEYDQFLEQWALEHPQVLQDTVSRLNDISDINTSQYDTNEPNMFDDFNEPNAPQIIRGPYGPTWPLIAPPIEFEIGQAKIKIEIEDENAKYPIGWVLLGDKDVQREVEAGFEIFCEWMNLDNEDVDDLKDQLAEIGKIKPFKITFKPPKKAEKKSASRKSRRRRTSRRKRTVSKGKRHTLPAAAHSMDFAKLFNSSMLDADVLARPTIISDTRKESALKYAGTWGANKVNINTAPRHVLEAALVFGGNEVEIAEAIIQRRRITPFATIDDLKQTMFGYSDSIKKCEKYITTTSNFFTIRITATNGAATASAVIGMIKEGTEVKHIAVLSG